MPHPLIQSAYDPALFQEAGQVVLEILSSHLTEIERRHGSVLNLADPVTLTQEARKILDAAPGPLGPGEGAAGAAWSGAVPRAAGLAQAILERGQNLHHPRYVGHQVPPPVPLAGLFDMIGSVTNQAMAIFEMGPWATAVEHAVIDAVGERLGFVPKTFSGLITSGGSLANLTGLLAARSVSLPEAWRAGLPSSPRPVLVAHADAHYSVMRSAGIMGLGTDQVVKAPLDTRRRIDPTRLDEILGDLRNRGVPIVAVSGAACATPIGAFDPLTQLAEVCERHEVWLHVDSAHGGAACFSARHRHLLRGIERADSVVCDAHKMMCMPALCAMLFYRNPAHRLAPFHQEAPYLFNPASSHTTDFDSGVVNLECTKRAAALSLWGVWSIFGPELFGVLVDEMFERGREFYEILSETDDFEPLHEPECNIVAFRHVPRHMNSAPTEVIDAFQLRLRQAVVESGRFYLVQTNLDGRNVLRVTLMNPLTTRQDLHELLDCLRELGQQIG